MSQHPSNGSSSNQRHDYLVRAREAPVLAHAIAYIEADAGAHLVRCLGPHDAPHTLLVEMTERSAAALAQHFAGEIIVERDRPLTAFEGPS